MAKFWDDFKAFALKGNFIDMAVGVVIGAAFGKIVTSLVNDILMPLIGWAIGGVDLSSLKIPLKGTLAGNVIETSSSVIGADSEVMDKVSSFMAQDAPEVAYLRYGDFIQEVIDFFVIALCIFLCIRLVARLDAKLRVRKAAEETAAAANAAPAPKPEDIALLEEIRDLLKASKK